MPASRADLAALLDALAGDPDLAQRLQLEPASVLAEWELTDDELARLDRRLRRQDGLRLDQLFALPADEADPLSPWAAPTPEENP
ncbi:MAG: hypothetical protein MUF83_04250 [Acidimicrobiales bacterium]|nr:hypothetical protein [Acidimicrobiales bacterium]